MHVKAKLPEKASCLCLGVALLLVVASFVCTSEACMVQFSGPPLVVVVGALGPRNDENCLLILLLGDIDGS